MLTLYHADTSVCSVKARIALAEKELEWESALLDLHKGEQQAPDYMALNPEGVVPTLVHDGFVVRDSSAIISYVDCLDADRPLLPSDRRERAVATMWLIRTIEIHAAINTMSFATLFRDRQLAAYTSEQIEARLSKLPNPQIAAKRRDILRRGPESVFVRGALHTLSLMFTDMRVALDCSDWLCPSGYGLSDIALIAYVDRLDHLGMAGLWEDRFPQVRGWLERNRARSSYNAATAEYVTADMIEGMKNTAGKHWPAIAHLAR